MRSTLLALALAACSGEENAQMPSEPAFGPILEGQCVSVPLQTSYQMDFPGKAQDLVICEGKDGVQDIEMAIEDERCKLNYTIQGQVELTAQDGTEYAIHREETMESCLALILGGSPEVLGALYQENQMELQWGSGALYTETSRDFPESLPPSGIEFDVRKFIPISEMGRTSLTLVDNSYETDMCIGIPSSREVCTGWDARDDFSLIRRIHFPEYVSIESTGLDEEWGAFSTGHSLFNEEPNEYVVRANVR